MHLLSSYYLETNRAMAVRGGVDGQKRLNKQNCHGIAFPIMRIFTQDPESA